MQKKKRVKHRPKRRTNNNFTQTNNLIRGTTKAVIGLGVLGATVGVLDALKK
jgi:hypothetical protein